jgi:hypothetical protein
MLLKSSCDNNLQKNRAHNVFKKQKLRDAKWAQDDVNFGTAPGDGGNQIPADADERGHVIYRV